MQNSFIIDGSENNEINIERIPDYKVPSADKYLEDDGTTLTMTFMMMTMSSKQKAESLSKLRASSYEPGNRAGSVTGTNFVVCSYGKF